MTDDAAQPRRFPGDHLFPESQAVIDVAPEAVPWIRAVAAAQATDDTTLLRIHEGLAKL